MKWYSKTEYIDIDTGEIITKKTALQYYYIIKTIKKTTYNENKTIGNTQYTNECRIKNQLELEFK